MATPVLARDRLLFNGKVWIGSITGRTAQAVLISGEHIAAVGTNSDMLAAAPADAERTDLDGHLVLPGFIDSHVHFFWGALSLASVDLHDADTSAEFVRRIAARASARPGEWILYGNWDHERWGGTLPNRSWIDPVTGDTPVFVQRSDGHMALANSAALRLAGIDAHMRDPVGGQIVRDGSGRPTGIVKDAAMALVEAHVPPASDARMDEALRIASDLALSKGITRVQDMSEGNWSSLAAFRRNREAGRLRIRIDAFVPIAEHAKLAAMIAAQGHGDDWLRWGGVKGFVDGSLGSSTAWFQAPYADAPDNRGLTATDLEQLGRDIQAANSEGLQIALHAIGDRANQWALDRFAGLPHLPGAALPRIEHAQHLDPADVPRFAQEGVIASMQPYHAIDDGRWAEARIGAGRLKGAYALHTLLQAGAVLALGSDWPVAPLDPIAGIDAAVNRRTLDGLHPEGWQPQEKISVEEAVRGYTQGAAMAAGIADRAGQIAPGFLADITILSDDIFAIDPHCIPHVTILRTIVGGEDRLVAPPEGPAKMRDTEAACRRSTQPSSSSP